RAVWGGRRPRAGSARTVEGPDGALLRRPADPALPANHRFPMGRQPGSTGRVGRYSTRRCSSPSMCGSASRTRKVCIGPSWVGASAGWTGERPLTSPLRRGLLGCRMDGFVGDTTALLARTPELLRTLLIGLPQAWTDTPD